MSTYYEVCGEVGDDVLTVWSQVLPASRETAEALLRDRFPDVVIGRWSVFNEGDLLDGSEPTQTQEEQDATTLR